MIGLSRSRLRRPRLFVSICFTRHRALDDRALGQL